MFKVSVHKRRFALGPLKFTAGVATAARGAVCTGQQYVHTEHRQRADHNPEKEQRAGRTGDVITQHREVLAQWVSRPGIVQHADESDDDGEEENNQSNDDNHAEVSNREA